MKINRRNEVLRAFPTAVSDFYEHLKGQGLPCWFIKHAGGVLSPICISPQSAWKKAYEELAAAEGGAR
jgi:hypothetical protein